MNEFNFGMAKLPDYLDAVDEKIKAVAPENMPGITRLLKAGGKRLRPGMVIAVAYYSGKKVDDRIIAAAAAIELVHVASLIHDDIIDDGTVRWGVPTISAQEGMNAAILAGDYLLAKACVLATGVSAEAGSLLAETIAILCAGEAQEIQDRFNTGRTIDALNQAIHGKTSSLFMAACNMGGLVAGLPSKQLAILSEFAGNFGLAYQYLDDVRDLVEPTGSSGKSAGTDIPEGNYTLPVLLSLSGPHSAELKKLLDKGAQASKIVKLLQADGSIEQTLVRAAECKQKAQQALQALENQKLAKAVGLLTDQFLSKT